MAAAPARSRRRRWWGGGLLAVVLAGVAGIVVGEATGWPLLRGPLQQAASRAAGVPVQFGGGPDGADGADRSGRAGGGFVLHLLGRPSLRVGHLQVGAAQGVPAPHLLQADDVLLAWRWGDVWRWHRGAPLRIAVLQAGRLDAHLVRLADGRATWALGALGTSDTAPGARPAPARHDAAAWPRIGRLQVGAGQLQVDDALLDTVLQVRLAGGEGEGGGRALPMGPAPAASGASAPAAGGAAPSNGYTATIDGRWQAVPLALALRMGAALPLLHDDSGPAAPAQPLRIEGSAGAARLLFDGRAAALLGARWLDGMLHLEGPSLAAVGAPLRVTLPRTPPFVLDGRLAHDAGLWTLQAAEARIGRSRLGGQFRFDTRVQPRRLSGRLAGPLLALADLGPAVGTPGEGRGATTTPPPRQPPGKLLPQRRFDLPSLRAMDADVAVAIDRLDLGSAALAPLQAVRGRVLLQAGVLQLLGLQAGVAGGQLAGDTRLDGRGDAARWTVDLQASGLDIAAWVRALRTPAAGRPGTAAARRPDAPPPPRSYLGGVLAADLQLQGSGSSTAQILGSLQGDARLRLHDGTLSHLVTEAAGIDLAQALGVLVRGDAALPLRCAVLDLALDQGVAQVRRGVLDNRDSTLRLDGRIDLRQETLALRARARPKDFSPLALRVPVLVTGTLAAPRIGLDGRALGARAAAAAALAVVAAPVAALLPFVDPGEDPPGDPCAAAAPSAPPSPPAAPAQPASAPVRR